MVYGLSKLEDIYFKLNLIKPNVSQFNSFSALSNNGYLKILLTDGTANSSNLAYKKQRLLICFILPFIASHNSTRQSMSLGVLLLLI